MEMGTGKTRTCIMDMQARQPELSLVVCPAAVVPVWPSEFTKYAPGEFDILPLGSGPLAKRAAVLGQWLAARRVRADRPGVVVTNYEAMWKKALFPALRGAGFKNIIADESHRAKSAGSKTSLALYNLTGGAAGHPATRPLARCLTGTPMPHNFTDLYGQYRFMWPWAYGWSKANFMARYAVMGGFEGRKVVGIQDDRYEEFMGIFQKHAFVVRTDDVLDLPPFTDTNYYCTLSPKEARAYAEMRKELVAELEAGRITAATAAVKFMRLAQICSGVARTEDGRDIVVGDSKAKLLADVLQDIDMQEPIVVFCRFSSDIAQVREVMDREGWPCGELSGRRNDLAAWQDGLYKGLAVQFQAGGVGVDMTRARYHINFSLDFNLGNHLQARARTRRSGQERTVHYVNLLARGTVDEYILKCLTEREDVIEKMLEEIKTMPF